MGDSVLAVWTHNWPGIPKGTQSDRDADGREDAYDVERIDVKPGSFRNGLDPRSRGDAILDAAAPSIASKSALLPMRPVSPGTVGGGAAASTMRDPDTPLSAVTASGEPSASVPVIVPLKLPGRSPKPSSTIVVPCEATKSSP